MVKQSNKQRILITGGAGLIGTAARNHFEERGWDVTTLDLKEFALDGRKIDHVGDICQIITLQEILSDIDGILHLAAVSRVIDAELDKPECTRVNVDGTRRLLQVASATKCRWFIFGSSREVYGEPTLLPVKEEHGVSPINHYGFAKVEGERMVKEYCEQNGMSHSILRFSNVYGHPGDHPTRLVNAFLWNALHSEPLEVHGGGQLFDLTHIDDTASAIFNAANFMHSESRDLPPIHVLSGNPVAIEDLARLVLEITGSDSQIIHTQGRDYDVNRFYGDPSRLQNILRYRCQISIHEGLEMAAKLFRRRLGINTVDAE